VSRTTTSRLTTVTSIDSPKGSAPLDPKALAIAGGDAAAASGECQATGTHPRAKAKSRRSALPPRRLDILTGVEKDAGTSRRKDMMQPLFQPSHLVFLAIYVGFLLIAGIVVGLVVVLVVRRFGVEIHVTRSPGKTDASGSVKG
jgi:hypothetical protein